MEKSKPSRYFDNKQELISFNKKIMPPHWGGIFSMLTEFFDFLYVYY